MYVLYENSVHTYPVNYNAKNMMCMKHIRFSMCVFECTEIYSTMEVTIGSQDLPIDISRSYTREV